MKNIEKIKDEKLRKLVENSPSILSLPEDLQGELIERIADLQGGTYELESILLKETDEMAKDEANRKSDVQKYKDLIEKLSHDEKQSKKDISKEVEFLSKEEEEKKQEELLKDLE